MSAHPEGYHHHDGSQEDLESANVMMSERPESKDALSMGNMINSMDSIEWTPEKRKWEKSTTASAPDDPVLRLKELREQSIPRFMKGQYMFPHMSTSRLLLLSIWSALFINIAVRTEVMIIWSTRGPTGKSAYAHFLLMFAGICYPLIVYALTQGCHLIMTLVQKLFMKLLDRDIYWYYHLLHLNYSISMLMSGILSVVCYVFLVQDATFVPAGPDGVVDVTYSYARTWSTLFPIYQTEIPGVMHLLLRTIVAILIIVDIRRMLTRLLSRMILSKALHKTSRELNSILVRYRLLKSCGVAWTEMRDKQAELVKLYRVSQKSTNLVAIHDLIRQFFNEARIDDHTAEYRVDNDKLIDAEFRDANINDGRHLFDGFENSGSFFHSDSKKHTKIKIPKYMEDEYVTQDADRKVSARTSYQTVEVLSHEHISLPCRGVMITPRSAEDAAECSKAIYYDLRQLQLMIFKVVRPCIRNIERKQAQDPNYKLSAACSTLKRKYLVLDSEEMTMLLNAEKLRNEQEQAEFKEKLDAGQLEAGQQAFEHPKKRSRRHSGRPNRGKRGTIIHLSPRPTEQGLGQSTLLVPTISEQIDQEDSEVVNEEEENEVVKYIDAVANGIEAEDKKQQINDSVQLLTLQLILGEKFSPKALSDLMDAQDQTAIPCGQLTKGVEKLIIDKDTIVHRLKNQRQMLTSVESMFSVILWVPGLAVLFMIGGGSLVGSIVTVSGLIASLTVVLASFHSTFMNSLILVAFNNPFKIGDRLLVDGNRAIVQKTHLFHMIAGGWDDKLQYLPYNLLSGAEIKNDTPTTRVIFCHNFMISDQTSKEKITILRRMMENYVKLRPYYYVNDAFYMRVNEVQPGHYLELKVYACYKHSHHFWIAVARSKSEFILFLLRTMQVLNISYSKPVVPITTTTSPSAVHTEKINTETAMMNLCNESMQRKDWDSWYGLPGRKNAYVL